MEAARKFEEASPEKSEKEPHYNFSEIAEMEPAMISLVEKLKDKIESGEYDTLISDGVGGRIPTRILREVMMKSGNRDTARKLNTFFLPGGGMAHDLSSNKKFNDFVTKKLNPLVESRALLVTEFVDTGHSIRTLTKALEKAGFSKFDIAIATIREGTEKDAQLVPGHKSFYGSIVRFTPKLYFTDARLGGVKKESISDRIHIFRLKNENQDYQKKQEIQKDIHQAREDAHTIAEKILKKVW